jgi:UDP-N-acetylmuramoyl-L-alanyl-D-glutamate--2,6-diaminopimelate ligase
VKSGDAFIAWPGYAHDAREFVKGALEQGASACIVEAQGLGEYAALKQWDSARVRSFANLKHEAGLIANAYYDQPSQDVRVLGVTGTNGKTSVTWWLGAALGLLGFKCGVIGTFGVGEVNATALTDARTKSGQLYQIDQLDQLAHFTTNGLTTPDPLTLQKSLAQFKEQSARYCALEASSIGIVEHRLSGTRIHAGIFTNLSRDHLDYHPSMQAYWEAKRALFDWPDLKLAIINVDDPHGIKLFESLKVNRKDVRVIGFGESEHAQLKAREVIYPNERGGLSFEIGYCDKGQPLESGVLSTAFLGRYNVSNLLAVMALLLAEGFKLEEVLSACSKLPPVMGRMQRVEEQGADAPCVVVDYAHTPDALEKALQSLKPIGQAQHGKLHCVVGCGGQRDPGKRPQMAKVASLLADSVTLTSDNPRSEQAQDIINDMLAGLDSNALQSTFVEIDRSKAIHQTIARAKRGDVVLIAGKGHENYQEINGVKTAFSDVLHAKQALSKVAHQTLAQVGGVA